MSTHRKPDLRLVEPTPTELIAKLREGLQAGAVDEKRPSRPDPVIRIEPRDERIEKLLRR